jgi:hypothetical protein
VGLESLANYPVTVISSGGTTSSDTSFTAASPSGFPSVSNATTPPTTFHIADVALPGEIMEVTLTSGGTWTVVRGAEGTTPVSHTAGWTAKLVLTAGQSGRWPQWYNVRSVLYGAKGNGSTDDSGAIQAAINAAHTAGGGVVYLPEGAYKLNSTLLMKSSITLKGAGALVSTLRPASGVTAITVAGSSAVTSQSFTATNASPCVFTVGSGSAPAAGTAVTLSGGSLPTGFTAGPVYYVVVSSGTTFQLASVLFGTALGSSSTGSGTVAGAGQVTQTVYADFGIVGPGQGDSGAAPGMSLSWSTTGTVLERLYITTLGGDGIQASNSYSLSMEDVWLVSNGSNGLHAELNANNWHLRRVSSLLNTQWGYYIMGGAAVLLSNCDGESNPYGGCALLGTFSATVEAGEWENNGSSSSGQKCAVYVGAGTTPYSHAQNTTISGAWIQGTSVATYGVVVDDGILTTIEGNGFQNNITANINVTSSASATLIRPNNYLAGSTSPANITDSGSNTQNLDYDTVNHVMRSQGMSLGPVGSAADITLTRAAAGRLLLTGASTLGQVLKISNSNASTSVPNLYFGGQSASDLAVGATYTGQGFTVWQIRNGGTIQWGPGSAAVDTNLARLSAGILQATDSASNLASVQAIETAHSQRILAV